MTKTDSTFHLGVRLRYDKSDLKWFMLFGWTPLLTGAIFMATSSISYLGLGFMIGPLAINEGTIMILPLLALSMTFFVGVEWYVLCRHCPIYQYSGQEHDNEKRFYCVGNWGSPKLFRYKPGKISWIEKVTFILWPTLSFCFPLLYVLDRFELILIQLLIVFVFWFTLNHWLCASCPNFGCILNHVPSDQRREFQETMTKWYPRGSVEGSPNQS
ncbi:hypothetical protein [[Eubacterium] cellulosolvens]